MDSWCARHRAFAVGRHPLRQAVGHGRDEARPRPLLTSQFLFNSPSSLALLGKPLAFRGMRVSLEAVQALGFGVFVLLFVGGHFCVEAFFMLQVTTLLIVVSCS